MVIRAFSYFPPALCSVSKVPSGVIYQNNAESFILYIFSFVYEFPASRISCNSTSITTRSMAPTSPCYLYFLILCLAVKPSNHPIENLGTSWPAYCGNFCHSVASISFKISSVTLAFFCSILCCRIL